MKSNLIRLSGLLFILFCFGQTGFSQELIQLRLITHLSSTVSDGKYSLHEVAAIAKENGIGAVAFTDKGFMRWDYGLRPLPNIIRKTVVGNSIAKYGIKKYLNDIEKIQKEFPDMIFMPGLDAAPFYYWQGSAIKGNLTMRNWHKHILAIGLYDHDSYYNLPVISNHRGIRKGFDVLGLWPILLLVIGILWIRKSIIPGVHFRGRLSCGWIAVFISILFLLNNWPFLKLEFDQYHLEYGVLPYQSFIDYVDKKGGLSFWAHPEAENISRRGNIGIETKEYVDNLFTTKNYTGFSIFPEGYRKVGKLSGIWDALLDEYCKGIRKKPVWSIGGLAFDQKGDLSEAMQKSQTIVLAAGLTSQAVLDSLRQGRMYVVKGDRSLYFALDKFIITDEFDRVRGISGDDIDIEGKPILHIEGGFLGQQQELTIEIIKNGELHRSYKMETPFKIIYRDDNAFEGKSYYRLEIKGSGLHLVTNPIFVR